MRKNFFFAIMAALLTVSCSEQDDLLVEQQNRDKQEYLDPNVISFGAVINSMDGADTRASGEASIADLKTGTGFGVLASYTGVNRYGDVSVTTDFMYNQQVEWDNANNVWAYTPVMYWPNGEGQNGETPNYVSFFGYAPYSDMDGSDPDANPAGYSISGISQAHVQGNPWLTYRLIPQENLDKQVDLLYAKQLDQTKTALGSKVEFAFEHALACVGDEVAIGADDNLKAQIKAMVVGGTTKAEVVLTEVNIKYTLAEKGRLVLWNRGGVANWQPVLSEDLTTERVHQVSATLPKTIFSYDGTAETTYTWEDSGNGVFFIPLKPDVVAQKATITVKYEVKLNGAFVHTTKEVSSTISLDDYTAPGEKVALKVNLTGEPQP